jgi:hypothetical protein
LALVFATCNAVAGTTTLNDIARGAYVDAGIFGTGGAGTSDGNYLTGLYSGSGYTEYRSFFTFDLSGLTGNVTSATFSVDFGPPAYGSGQSPVFFNLVAYAGDIIALDNGTAGVAGFGLLGGPGVFLGGAYANTTDTGVVTYTITPAGLAAIQASEGGLFAIGGSLTGFIGPDDYLFGNSIFTSTNQLVVNTSPVPEPSTLLLFAPGALGVAAWMRRKLRG